MPTVYLALALAAIQASDAAARSAAVGAARSWARNGDPVEAKRVAQESLQHRVDGPEVTAIDLACAPTACTWPQGVASATVTLSVSLPIVPALPGVPALTSVSATADYPVARFGRDGATR
ncbi:hypothetical protein FM119_06225 [Mycetocola reblochoni REB411]|uniref:Uncharacterized protein n=1 Tax=Mycetocola reblochoni REB411 TaxID=1255698 RepID=A0A1R4J9U0_9MICO|nr:hypothetical protein FM119_06225 [Mycetocola reblochoni REB411]